MPKLPVMTNCCWMFHYSIEVLFCISFAGAIDTLLWQKCQLQLIFWNIHTDAIMGVVHPFAEWSGIFFGCLCVFSPINSLNNCLGINYSWAVAYKVAFVYSLVQVPTLILYSGSRISLLSLCALMFIESLLIYRRLIHTLEPFGNWHLDHFGSYSTKMHHKSKCVPQDQTARERHSGKEIKKWPSWLLVVFLEIKCLHDKQRRFHFAHQSFILGIAKALHVRSEQEMVWSMSLVAKNNLMDWPFISSG